jgi:hypothetical protein
MIPNLRGRMPNRRLRYPLVMNHVAIESWVIGKLAMTYHELRQRISASTGISKLLESKSMCERSQLI